MDAHRIIPTTRSGKDFVRINRFNFISLDFASDEAIAFDATKAPFKVSFIVLYNRRIRLGTMYLILDPNNLSYTNIHHGNAITVSLSKMGWKYLKVDSKDGNNCKHKNINTKC